MTQFHIRLPDPARARGEDEALSFRSHGADGLAEELQNALATDSLFQRWLGKQEEPDDVDPALGRTDPDAQVTGEQSDLSIFLHIRTNLPGEVVRQRLRWLAGSHWELRNVTA
jgi:hypothetical protein